MWLMGLCPSSTAGSGPCGLGQGSQEEERRNRGHFGGWSLLSQQPSCLASVNLGMPLSLPILVSSRVQWAHSTKIRANRALGNHRHSPWVDQALDRGWPAARSLAEKSHETEISTPGCTYTGRDQYTLIIIIITIDQGPGSQASHKGGEILSVPGGRQA